MSGMKDKNDERYFKDLELVLKAAQDDYKQVTYDARSYQQTILRNYAWLATVLVGVQVALLSFAKPAGAISLIFLGISMLLAVISFILSMDAMRGRGLMIFPYESTTYQQLSDMAWYRANNIQPPYCNEKELPTDNLMRVMIECLQNSIDENRKIVHSTGLRMRKICKILVATTATTSITAVSCMIYFLGN